MATWRWQWRGRLCQCIWWMRWPWPWDWSVSDWPRNHEWKCFRSWYFGLFEIRRFYEEVDG